MKHSSRAPPVLRTWRRGAPALIATNHDPPLFKEIDSAGAFLQYQGNIPTIKQSHLSDLSKPSSAVGMREGGVSQLPQADPHKPCFTLGEAGCLGAKPCFAQAPAVQEEDLASIWTSVMQNTTNFCPFGRSGKGLPLIFVAGRGHGGSHQLLCARQV